MPDSPRQTALPGLNRAQWRAALRGDAGGPPLLPKIRLGDWRGQFLRKLPVSRPWTSIEGAEISLRDWQTAWPSVLDGLNGAWKLLKTDRAGDIATGSITLGGRAVEVVAKRPRRTRAGQWAADLLRSARARRSWSKTWTLLSRGLPTEIPLLIMERRRGPLVLDNVVVFEAVPGPTLFHIRLDDLPGPSRQSLLNRVGRTIRQTEAMGFALRDAKTTNWIAFDDGSTLLPVMLDCDGIRHFPRPGAGLRRFLKALARHPQFRSQDCRDVCDGYAGGEWPRRVRALFDRYSAPSAHPARWNVPAVATGHAEAPRG